VVQHINLTLTAYQGLTLKRKDYIMSYRLRSTDKKDPRPLFYGVPNVRLNWRGEWADPTVQYRLGWKTYTVNYFELEAMLWSDFTDIELSSDEDEFAQWVRKHPRLVKEYIRTLNQERRSS